MGKRELPLRMTDAEYKRLSAEAEKYGIAPLTYIRWRLGLSIEPDAYKKLPPEVPYEKAAASAKGKGARSSGKRKADLAGKTGAGADTAGND